MEYRYAIVKDDEKETIFILASDEEMINFFKQDEIKRILRKKHNLDRIIIGTHSSDAGYMFHLPFDHKISGEELDRLKWTWDQIF